MITSISNSRVKMIRSLQSQRKTRSEERAFVLEGERLAGEVLQTLTPVKLVFHTERFQARHASIINELERLGAEIEQVSDVVMRACSSTEAPSGLLMVAPIPNLKPPSPLSLVVFADGLADPGNLGTLMRTALAAGVEALFTAEGSVDAFNPKVVRGAMGAHLRLPIVEVAYPQVPEHLAGLKIRVASAGEGQPFYEVDWGVPSALVIGGEAHGVSAQVQALACEHVHIPMPGDTDSLNAAVSAAVILFEIVRQRGAE